MYAHHAAPWSSLNDGRDTVLGEEIFSEPVNERAHETWLQFSTELTLEVE